MTKILINLWIYSTDNLDKPIKYKDCKTKRLEIHARQKQKKELITLIIVVCIFLLSFNLILTPHNMSFIALYLIFTRVDQFRIVQVYPCKTIECSTKQVMLTDNRLYKNTSLPRKVWSLNWHTALVTWT